MFILHVPDALQHTSPDRVTQILRRRLRMYRTEINRPVHTLDAPHAAHHVHRRERGGRGVRAERAKMRRGGGRGDEGLRGGGLGLVGGGLLRFGDVGAAVFAKVDALACPAGFGGEGVDYL
jgi:hypothetical protein